MSRRRPEISVPIALGTVGIVIALYQQTTPPQADIRLSTPGDGDHAIVNKSRRQASWFGFGVLSFTSLMLKDPTPMILGGAVIIGLDWWTRYNNEVHPGTGRVLRPGEQSGTTESPAPDMASVADIRTATGASVGY